MTVSIVARPHACFASGERNQSRTFVPVHPTFLSYNSPRGLHPIGKFLFAHSAQGLRRYSDWSENPSTFATRSIYEPLARYISPYKMETEPSALDHTSTVVLDTTPLVLVLSPPHWVSPNTSSDKSERLRVPVLVCGTPRSDPSSRDRIRDKVKHPHGAFPSISDPNRFGKALLIHQRRFAFLEGPFLQSVLAILTPSSPFLRKVALLCAFLCL